MPQISQENTCDGVSFNKIVSLQDWNFIKKRLQHRCFSVLKTPILKNICEQLHLENLTDKF